MAFLLPKFAGLVDAASEPMPDAGPNHTEVRGPMNALSPHARSSCGWHEFGMMRDLAAAKPSNNTQARARREDNDILFQRNSSTGRPKQVHRGVNWRQASSWLPGCEGCYPWLAPTIGRYMLAIHSNRKLYKSLWDTAIGQCSADLPLGHACIALPTATARRRVVYDNSTRGLGQSHTARSSCLRDQHLWVIWAPVGPGWVQGQG